MTRAQSSGATAAVVLTLISLWGPSTTASAQVRDFSGSYALQTDRGDQINLNLIQDARGNVQGSLSGTGDVFEVRATAEGEVLVGNLFWDREAIYFEAYFDNRNLVVYFGDDARTGIDYFRVRQLVFVNQLQTPNRNSDPRSSGRNPLAARDPGRNGTPSNFDGRFAGEGLLLELRSAGVDHSGRLTIDGQTYAVSGRLVEGQLRGAFGNGFDRFEFTAFLDDYGITLESGGQAYFLQPQTETAGGPPLPFGSAGNTALSDGTPLAQEWVEILRGRRLVPRDERGRQTREAEIGIVHLCTSGRYLRERTAGGGPTRPNPNTQLADGSGRWFISSATGQATLELYAPRERVDHYTLSMRAGLVYLDAAPMQLDFTMNYCR